MKLETSQRGDVTMLTVSGELDADSAPMFNQAVADALAAQGRDFLVELSGVTRIDSAGLEALSAAQRQSEEQLGITRLCGANETTRKILEITRLDKVFTVYDSVEEALASFFHA